jgi:hypothetical protein
MQVAGGGQGYDKIPEFLRDNAEFKIITCIVFSEKPRKLLITGSTKIDGYDDRRSMEKAKGTGKGVDERLAQYLPMLTDEEYAEVMKDRETERLRKHFGAFSKVNFSMARRVAMVALEYLPTDFNPVVAQFFSKYDNKRPSEITIDDAAFAELSSDSVKVKREQIMRFKSEAKYWKADSIVAIFKGKPAAAKQAE